MGANGEANATEVVERPAAGRDLVDRARTVLTSSHTTGGGLSCAADAFAPSVIHAFAARGPQKALVPQNHRGRKKCEALRYTKSAGGEGSSFKTEREHTPRVLQLHFSLDDTVTL
jgi:hypothetical protein